MNIHEELWNAFSDIFFEEETHTYTDSNGTKYTSATGWIHQFSPEKDWDAIAAKKAAKTGEDPEELKAKWKASGDYAKTLGTAVHSVLENLWYKKNFNPDPKIFEQFPEMKEDFLYRKKTCQNLFNKMKNIYAPVANEFIVYDQENGLCRNY